MTRHWCALTEELKSALQRLENSSVSIDTVSHAKILESFSILKVTYLFSLGFVSRVHCHTAMLSVHRVGCDSLNLARAFSCPLRKSFS